MSLFLKLCDLLFPKMCAICLHEVVDGEGLVCESCSEYLARMQGSLCKTCGHAVHACRCNVPKTLSTATSVFWHSGLIKKYVGTMKEKRYDALFDYGAQRMSRLISESEYYLAADAVTYVPRPILSYKSVLVDPAMELARRISEQTGIPLVTYLESKKKHYEQKELSVKERMKNVKGAFAMAKGAPTPYGRIILVDDVMTTGATANECARVLKKAGPCEVAGLFLSRTHHEELIN